MNIDDLFKVLTSASNTAEQDSPYAPISGFADQMGKAIDQQAASGGFRGRIGPALVSGLLSGIVGGTAKNLTDTYVEKQNDLARNVLADALSGRALTNAPDGMSPTVFSNIQNAGVLYHAGRLQEQQDKEAALKREIALRQTHVPLDTAGQALAVKLGMSPELASTASDDDIKLLAQLVGQRKAQDAEQQKAVQQLARSPEQQAVDRLGNIVAPLQRDATLGTPTGDTALMQDVALARNPNSPSSRPGVVNTMLQNRPLLDRAWGWFKANAGGAANALLGTNVDAGYLTDQERASMVADALAARGASLEGLQARAQTLGAPMPTLPAGFAGDGAGADGSAPAAGAKPDPLGIR